MFARRVYMHLKPNSVAEFTQRLEKDILLCFENRKDSRTSSRSLDRAYGSVRNQFVGQAENAEAYNRGTYPEVTKILAAVVDGAPQVEPMTSPTRRSTRSPLP